MLRMQGYAVAKYNNHVIATDKSFDTCLNTIEGTYMFQKLDFTTDPAKSKYILAKIVEYPGFINDSEKKWYLSDQKK